MAAPGHPPNLSKEYDMSVTPTAGDSGATGSDETVGTAAAPKAPAKKAASKRAATKTAAAPKAPAKEEGFKALKMTRKRDGQERTAYSEEDKVKYEFDGFYGK